MKRKYIYCIAASAALAFVFAVFYLGYIGKRPVKKAEQPSSALAAIKFERFLMDDDDNLFAALSLSNRTDQPCQFGARGGTPITQVDWLINGEWSKAMWNDCGTGIGISYLQPHQTIAFRSLLFPTNVPQRVGVHIAPSNSQSFELCWSDVIIPPKTNSARESLPR